MLLIFSLVHMHILFHFFTIVLWVDHLVWTWRTTVLSKAVFKAVRHSTCPFHLGPRETHFWPISSSLALGLLMAYFLLWGFLVLQKATWFTFYSAGWWEGVQDACALVEGSQLHYHGRLSRRLLVVCARRKPPVFPWPECAEEARGGPGRASVTVIWLCALPVGRGEQLSHPLGPSFSWYYELN